MGKLKIEQFISTNSVERTVKEFKMSSVIIYSTGNAFKTENFYLGRNGTDCSCNNDDDFKKAALLRYPVFKGDLSAAMQEITVESGVHYDFEDKFHEYFEENQHLAAYLLQRFLRENYTNIKAVKAVLHIVSHYAYDEIGEDFVFPIAALINHQNKGVKKFALKVFDNWDSIQTLSVLKGTEVVKERWLNDYKEKIIARLEGKGTNGIFCTCY